MNFGHYVTLFGFSVVVVSGIAMLAQGVSFYGVFSVVFGTIAIVGYVIDVRRRIRRGKP
jgi:hypothetical protein